MTNTAQNYEIKTNKGYNGWTAETDIVLEKFEKCSRILRISTLKGRGEICSHASVHIQNTNSISTDLFGDFNKRNIQVAPCKRVNEKAVLQVHQQAVLKIPALIEVAKAFYVNKKS